MQSQPGWTIVIDNKLPFDPSRDFVPVALVASQPRVLVVRTESPLKTVVALVAALVAAAKAKPGGQTDFMFATPQAVLSLIKGGKPRPLAITALRRLPVRPDAPTLDESGYKDFEASDWKAIVQQINAAGAGAAARARPWGACARPRR